MVEVKYFKVQGIVWWVSSDGSVASIYPNDDTITLPLSYFKLIKTAEELNRGEALNEIQTVSDKVLQD